MHSVKTLTLCAKVGRDIGTWQREF